MNTIRKRISKMTTIKWIFIYDKEKNKWTEVNQVLKTITSISDSNLHFIKTYSKHKHNICLHVRKYACMYVCMLHVWMNVWCIYACMNVWRIYVCIYAACMHVCMYVCKYVCM